MEHPRIAARIAPVASAANDASVTLDILDVLDTLGEGAILPDGTTLLTANASYERLTGYTFAELRALPNLFALIAPEEIPAAQERFLKRGMDVPRSEEYETTLVHKSGSRVRVEIASTTVPALGPKHVLSVVRDITRRKGSQDALRQSEERFRRAFDDAGIGMALYDAHGRFVRVNHALCDMLGYPEAELLSLDWRMLTHPDDVAPTEKRGSDFTHSASAPSALRLEKRYLRKDGGVIWGALTSSAIRDASGKIVQFVTQVVDVTARHLAEERLAERAAVFDASYDAIILADAFGRIREWSPGAERLYGYSREEAIGRDAIVLAPPGLEQEMLDLRAGKFGPTLETQRRCKDGTLVDVSIGVSALRDPHNGRLLGFVSIARDITSRKRADAEARRQVVARRLVRRLLRDVSGTGSIAARRALGKSLADEAKAATLEGHLDAIHATGLGDVVVVGEKAGERFTFTGENLLETAPGHQAPTCHIVLGYLEAAVASLSGRTALGTETACQSQGHARCTFVVRAR